MIPRSNEPTLSHHRLVPLSSLASSLRHTVQQPNNPTFRGSCRNPYFELPTHPPTNSKHRANKHRELTFQVDDYLSRLIVRGTRRDAWARIEGNESRDLRGAVARRRWRVGERRRDSLECRCPESMLGPCTRRASAARAYHKEGGREGGTRPWRR